MKGIMVRYGDDREIEIPLPEKEVNHIKNELVKFDGGLEITTTISTSEKEICKITTNIKPKATCPICNSSKISTFNENLSKCMICGEEFITRRDNSAK